MAQQGTDASEHFVLWRTGLAEWRRDTLTKDGSRSRQIEYQVLESTAAQVSKGVMECLFSK